MSPRKTILRELARNHETFTRPSTIRGFSEQPEKYQKAVNELLQARLLEGRKDDDGHMTIALNEHRLRDVHREIRPFWARPSVWAALVIGIAIGAVIAI